ncbi:hypothetical protein E2C01_006985 [Portunus trituberculatus]|uniref:Uncharacterized protein n=1 Tax=Portunus trituberculatus TaxID=210409 RepID=A0A5B7D162_PORTR|nr:hypothetical protein [Portunus trituberculatus]
MDLNEPRIHSSRRRHSLPDRRHHLSKHLTVFTLHNGGHRSPQHPDPILRPYPSTLQLHATVKGRLTPKSEQDTIRTFRFDDLPRRIKDSGQMDDKNNKNTPEFILSICETNKGQAHEKDKVLIHPEWYWIKREKQNILKKQ